MRHGSWGRSHPETGSPRGVRGRARGGPQRQRRAEARKRRRSVCRGASPGSSSRCSSATGQDCRDRRLAARQAERVRRERKDEREHGRLPCDRSKRAHGRRACRRLAPARPGGRLRPNLRRVLPACDARRRPRHGAPARGSHRLHARRPAHASADIDAVCAEHRAWG
jgi:hypothetical protein